MRLFLTVAVVNLLALVTPGPDFLYVSQAAVARSRRQALFAVAGIALGVMVWAALALLGLSLLLARVPWLGRLIALAGGGYLVWTGASMLATSLRRGETRVATAPLPPSDLAMLRRGFYTNLSNPKAVVFFASVFSALLAGGADAGARVGLWLLVVGETLAWFTLVATVFAWAPLRRAYLRGARWIDAGAGAVFIAFGLAIALAGWAS